VLFGDLKSSTEVVRQLLEETIQTVISQHTPFKNLDKIGGIFEDQTPIEILAF
jgi:hypothetical protein